MNLESELIPIYSYSDFINKLIRAGRNDGTDSYFRFGSEIDRSDFIKFANKFIEEYYASVSPDFSIAHPMKFSFGSISEDGQIHLNNNINSREASKYPGLNGALLYIKPNDGNSDNSHTLDASIFRQACFIKRERLKYLITIIGSIVAVITLALSLFLKR